MKKPKKSSHKSSRRDGSHSDRRPWSSQDVAVEHVVPPQPALPPLFTDDSDEHDKDRNDSASPSHEPAGQNLRLIHLDGTTLEGGGQLVRVALTLSALRCIPLHLTKIRGNRAQRSSGASGGLKESHLAALQFLARHSNTRVLKGDHIGAKEVVFVPTRPDTTHSVPSGIIAADQRLAHPTISPSEEIVLQKPGSVFLILQAILPYILFSDFLSRVADSQSDGHNAHGEHFYTLTLKGGTNVDKSMSGEYIQQVFLPALDRIGVRPRVSIQVSKRGWAGPEPEIGEVKVRIPISRKGNSNEPDGDDQARQYQYSQATQLSIFQPYANSTFSPSTAPEVRKISITVLAHNETIRTALLSLLTSQLKHTFPEVDTEILINEDTNSARHLYILLVAHLSNAPDETCDPSPRPSDRSFAMDDARPHPRLGADYLGTGRLAKSAAESAKLQQTAVQTVVGRLKAELDRHTTVDQYLEDQLVVFQALSALVDPDGVVSDSIAAVRISEENDDEEEEKEEEEGQREDPKPSHDVSNAPHHRNQKQTHTDHEPAVFAGTLHTQTVRWVCSRMLGIKWTLPTGDSSGLTHELPIRGKSLIIDRR